MADKNQFVISVKYSDGASGVLTGQEGKTLIFKTRREAEKYLSALMKGGKYSFNPEKVKPLIVRKGEVKP